MSEPSGGHEQSEQSGASKRVSGARERANGRASGPVLQSVFLAVIDHSVLEETSTKCRGEEASTPGIGFGRFLRFLRWAQFTPRGIFTGLGEESYVE